MLLPTNKTSSRAGAQTLSLLKIFNPTRDPEKKIGANLNGIPAWPVGSRLLVNPIKKILPSPGMPLKFWFQLSGA